MPEVLIALATGLAPPASALARSFIRLSTFIGVSSLCSSGAVKIASHSRQRSRRTR